MEKTRHQACSDPNAGSEYLQPQGSPFPTVTQQVCPDVACLGVNAENAPEAGAEGGHGGPVSVQEVIIVLEPVGQHVVRDHTPAPFPYLQHTRRIRTAQSPKPIGTAQPWDATQGEKFGFSDIRCPVGPCKPLTHILPFALHNFPGSDSQSFQGVILPPPQFPQRLTPSS